MTAGFNAEHWRDAQGNPAGGVSFGNGFAVSWQNGQLGREPERCKPNGAFVEDLIAVVIDRLIFYQASAFACSANQVALEHLQKAAEALAERTREREARQVEGTHQR